MIWTNKILKFGALNIIVFGVLLMFIFFAVANSEGYDIHNWFFENCDFFIWLPLKLWEFSPIENIILNILIATIISSIIYSFAIVYFFKLLKLLNRKLNSI